MVCHDLVVHKVDGRFRVYPPVILVNKRDKLVWRGYTTEITVYIPESKKPPTPNADGSVSWIAETPPVEYTYSIYCSADKTFAQGGSDPKIIVK